MNDYMFSFILLFAFSVIFTLLFVTLSEEISLVAVAELEFYTWGGQGVAKSKSGGPWTMTENQCITPT